MIPPMVATTVAALPPKGLMVAEEPEADMVDVGPAAEAPVPLTVEFEPATAGAVVEGDAAAAPDELAVSVAEAPVVEAAGAAVAAQAQTADAAAWTWIPVTAPQAESTQFWAADAMMAAEAVLHWQA